MATTRRARCHGGEILPHLLFRGEQSERPSLAGEHEAEVFPWMEIRKANLCSADLRGARIDKVDFYLVDLRGACSTRSRSRISAAAGAILEARA